LAEEKDGAVGSLPARAGQTRIAVRQRIAQPLSALIESGDVASTTLRTECARILSPIKDSSHLLLACHGTNPAILPVLQDFVGGETIFIDPAAALINRIKRWKIPAAGADIFFTSGEPEKMKAAAFKAFRRQDQAGRKNLCLKERQAGSPRGVGRYPGLGNNHEQETQTVNYLPAGRVCFSLPLLACHSAPLVGNLNERSVAGVAAPSPTAVIGVSHSFTDADFARHVDQLKKKTYQAQLSRSSFNVLSW